MSDQLERWYARLLWMYPAAYRRDRGAELLATLVESAEPGQARPSLRESTALVLAGLRARAGVVDRRPARLTWLSSLRTGALMLLVYNVALNALSVGLNVPSGIYDDPFKTPGWALDYLPMVPCIWAIIAVLRSRYPTAVAAAALAFAIQVMDVPVNVGFESWPWPLLNVSPMLPLAIGLLIPLARVHPAVAPGSLISLATVPVLYIVVQYLLIIRADVSFWSVRLAWMAALCLFGVVWAAVDERVGLALGLLLLNDLLNEPGMIFVANWDLPQRVISGSLAVIAPAVLLAVGTMRARRQAQL